MSGKRPLANPTKPKKSGKPGKSVASTKPGKRIALFVPPPNPCEDFLECFIHQFGSGNPGEVLTWGDNGPYWAPP